jgi:hypothetical protein
MKKRNTITKIRTRYKMAMTSFIRFFFLIFSNSILNCFPHKGAFNIFYHSFIFIRIWWCFRSNWFFSLFKLKGVFGHTASQTPSIVIVDNDVPNMNPF